MTTTTTWNGTPGNDKWKGTAGSDTARGPVYPLRASLAEKRILAGDRWVPPPPEWPPPSKSPPEADAQSTSSSPHSGDTPTKRCARDNAPTPDSD